MKPSTVFIVDDDDAVRDALALLFDTAGLNVRAFDSAEAFLAFIDASTPGCLVLDLNLPGMHGPQLQAELNRRQVHLPVLFLSAHGDIPTTVSAMKAGAQDFLTKPVDGQLLLQRVESALAVDAERRRTDVERQVLLDTLARLSQREKDVLALVVRGMSNKDIGRKLDISHRTVEVHRSRILLKTGAETFFELTALAKAADPDENNS